MSSITTVVEGEVKFTVGGELCKTWYKVFGDLASKARRPLVALHGGPGIDHVYLLTLCDLTAIYSIPLVVYDQIGSGRSTHLPEKKRDTSFWTVQLFLDELDNLLLHLEIADDYDILGHSWGGMLGSCHAVRQPAGLKHLILANSLPDMNLWLQAQWEIRALLSEDVQDTLLKHESDGTTNSSEYQAAYDAYRAMCVCRMQPMPQELVDSFAWIQKDPTVILTMYGPHQWEVSGTLKNWSILHELHKISLPTLLLNGQYDQANYDVIVPLFRGIKKVKWVTFAESSHVPHIEERERYMEVVGEFLKME